MRFLTSFFYFTIRTLILRKRKARKILIRSKTITVTVVSEKREVGTFVICNVKGLVRVFGKGTKEILPFIPWV